MLVSDVLSLPVLQPAHLATTQSNLSKEISGITIAEGPEIIQWLQGGEIVLLSLRTFTQADLFISYFPSLIEKGVSAIFVKNICEAPLKSIISLAQQKKVPLFFLPVESRFSQIISTVCQSLFQSKIAYYLEIESTLSAMAISGHSMEELLSYLVEYLPISVTLQTPEREQIGVFSSTAFSACPSIVDTLNVPIVCMNQVEGYLHVTSPQVIDENQETLIKSAAKDLAVLYFKNYHINQVEQKYQKAFLLRIFHGTISSEQLLESAPLYQWTNEDTFLLATSQFFSADDLYDFDTVHSLLDEALKDSSIFWHLENDTLFLLLHIKKEQNGALAHKKMIRLLNFLQNIVTRYSYTMYSGIGYAIYDPVNLAGEAKHAQEALKFSTLFCNSYVKYEDMGTLHHLLSTFTREELLHMIPSSIHALQDYDAENNTEYLFTLDHFLLNNMNLSQTAKDLFIHYKTMLHRMNRIAEITQISFNDSQQRLDIELGMKLYKLLRKS